MDNSVWSAEARRYSLLSENDRSEYWNQLTASQRDALSEALAAEANKVDVPKRRGCGRPVVAGCAGMIFGCVATIGVEVVLLMKGVSAVSDAIGSFSGIPSEPGSEEMPHFTGGLDNLTYNQLVEYCGTEWEEQYEEIANACNFQQMNDRLDERIYRDRQRQYGGD